MTQVKNIPERGNQPGVYEVENREGEKVRLVAHNFPQADAFVRMQATFIQDIESYEKEQLEKRIEAKRPKEVVSEKGKK